MFNANYSMMNANYSHMRGSPRRNAYSNRSFSQFGGKSQNFGRGMFFTSYPRGFLAGSSIIGGFGGGHAASLGRNQQFTHHPRSPHVRNVFSPAINSSISTGESNEPIPVCQICQKQGHTADACWYRYGDRYSPSSKQFGRGKMKGPKAAYMANFEPFSYQQSAIEDLYEFSSFNSSCQPVHYSLVYSYSSEAFTLPKAYVANLEDSSHEGWYLDSGATHHITNNMANMHVREEFKGLDQLTIGNGQGLIITHIDDAYFNYKSLHTAYKHTPITLKDILLVHSIAKNLISISKLTTDNNLSIEFVGNVCYVKDSLKGRVLLQGLAEKGLYMLLLKSSHTSPSSFLSQISSNKPLSMLSTCHFSFPVTTCADLLSHN